MPHDDLEYIPSIVATRDGQPERGDNRVRANKSEGNRPPGPQKQVAAGTGLVAWLFIVISLVMAAAVGWWAWQLQAQLALADEQIADYAARIGDLEARLSDTDEGMNQNAELQAVKIKELEGEVRKLWDNVWKDASQRLEKLEVASASQDKSVKGVQGTLAGTQSQLKSATGDIAGLKADIAEMKSISGDLARLIASAKTNQAEVERVADNLNQINLALAKLERRVVSNEEWVASINSFRKQVNTSLSQMQTAIRAQSAP
ncbi:Chromosome partition protein Smc [Halioglobus japonicus]|nr:Chromosome partition protein Smc [Halioglobus japonicus]